uniref:Single-stranded DNA-binding protein n=1 Tax=Parastrongyloides trichosuri TaxID=131310 RepID=A0A0N4Z5R1_PARTI
MNKNKAKFFPISGINLGVREWTICGIVTEKERIKVATKNNGYFKAFNFYLSDQKNDVGIKIAVFGKLVIPLDDIIQEGKKYIIKGGINHVKVSNKKFDKSKYRYKINIKKVDQVVACDEEIPSTPKTDTIVRKKTTSRNIKNNNSHI